MKSCAIFLVFGLLPNLAFSHASARLHEKDINSVFAGYDNAYFPDIVRLVSSGMDNELPRRFRAEIGSVPGNHRMLGHCWSFGDAIPRRVFEVIERKHPGSSEAFIAMWRDFSQGIVLQISQKTGLNARQAQAFASLIHDVHLLGDRTSDNKLVDYVLTTKEISNNMIKAMRVLWPSEKAFATNVSALFQSIQKDYHAEAERAEVLLSTVAGLGFGVRLNGIVKPPK